MTNVVHVCQQHKMTTDTNFSANSIQVQSASTLLLSLPTKQKRQANDGCPQDKYTVCQDNGRYIVLLPARCTVMPVFKATQTRPMLLAVRTADLVPPSTSSPAQAVAYEVAVAATQQRMAGNQPVWQHTATSHSIIDPPCTLHSLTLAQTLQCSQ